MMRFRTVRYVTLKKREMWICILCSWFYYEEKKSILFAHKNEVVMRYV